MGRHGHTTGQKVGFFCDSVLGNGHRMRTGRHRPALGQGLQGLCRHVFEFGGDGLGLIGQGLPACGVVVGGVHQALCHLRRRGIGVGVEHHHRQTQGLGRMGHHAPQLPTAEHAQGVAGLQWRVGRHAHAEGGTRMARAASVWRSRNARNCSATWG